MDTTASWFTVMHHFTTATDGQWPYGGVIIGSDSRLYGMAYGGGANGNGTIYSINYDATGFTVLRHLNSATDGSSPRGKFQDFAFSHFNSFPKLLT